VTVKVAASNPVDEETARHERILTSYLEKNPSHEGCKFVRKMLDNFEIPGEEGPYLCLVYEPMREPFYIFQNRCRNGVLPPALAKVYLRYLFRDSIIFILSVISSTQVSLRPRLISRDV
jgi:serine/threonine-protein kinase SRPK3